MDYFITRHYLGSRSFGDLASAPETMPIQDLPRGTGKGRTIPVSGNWWRYIERINSAPAYRWARIPRKMWINIPYDWESPYSTAYAESIMCSHNFGAFTEYNDTMTHGKMLHFSTDENPFENFSPDQVNWRTRPDLFFKAISVNVLGTRHLNVGANLDVYLPIMQRPGSDLWLALKQVEMFPRLPYHGFAGVWGVNVRSSYGLGAEIVGKLGAGEAFTVVRYKPLGASVWGQLDTGDWINLLLSEAPGQRAFYTSWSLKTLGVIPPAA